MKTGIRIRTGIAGAVMLAVLILAAGCSSKTQELDEKLKIPEPGKSRNMPETGEELQTPESGKSRNILESGEEPERTESEPPAGGGKTVPKTNQSGEFSMTDLPELYGADDEVRVMYLTVGRGSEEDGTDHSWEEVSRRPLSWYEKSGIEPYRCEALLQVGDEEGPLAGAFGYGERAANATVRLRGENASTQVQKSYRIDIRRSKGELDGQETILLNKYAGDPLRFMNRLAYRLMEGIPEMMSVRTRFVHLYVKDRAEGADAPFRDYGLYTQTERIGKDYLKVRGFDPDGQLYKVREFDWERHPDALLPATRPEFDKAAFERYLEIKGSDDHEKLIRLLDAVGDESLPAGQLVDTYFDRDNLFTWLAFHILTGNRSAASGGYYLYSPQGSRRWYFLGGDGDEIFPRACKRLEDAAYETSWRHGIFLFVKGKLFRRILTDEACREDLAGAVQRLAEELSLRRRLITQASDFAALVKPYVYALPDRLYARVTEEEYEELADEFAAEFDENARTYRESLSEPWPFHIFTPQREGKGLRLSWEEAYVHGGEKAAYTAELSDSYRFEDCIARAEETKETSLSVGALKAGQYFLRVRTAAGGRTQDAYEYYITEQGPVIYSTLCFYVLEDGSIEPNIYLEDIS